MATTALAVKAEQPVQTGLIRYDDNFDIELQNEMASEAALMQRDFRPVVYTVAAGGMLQFVNKKTSEPVASPLRCTILAVASVRAFWPQEQGEKVPFCSSKDCIVGEVNVSAAEATWQAAMKAPKQFAHPVIPLISSGGEYPTAFNCSSCPLDKFGSAYQKNGGGSGKGCQERRMLLVLPDGWFAPVIVSLSPGSLSAWKDYYSGLISSTGKSYFAMQTEIGLVSATSGSGIKYAQATFRKVAALTPAEIEDVKRLRHQFKSIIAPDTLMSDTEYYMSDSDVQHDVQADTEAENENPF